MILSLETIKYNLDLLKEVKIEFPILQDFEDGKISRSSLSDVGLDQYVELISYLKNLESLNQSVIYDKKLKYRDIKKTIAEYSDNQKVKNIFLNKTQNDFIKIFNDYKLNRRYTRVRNQSYCPALERAEPIILNFFSQNNIEFSDTYFRSWMFFKKIQKPKFYSRELMMTQKFLNKFIEFTKEKDLDLRKCNIKSLVSELQNQLRPLMKIEKGLYVKCINAFKNFTLDGHYLVEDSRIAYNGFLEIRLKNDLNETNYYPYSNFEEISRHRNDLFNELGI